MSCVRNFVVSLLIFNVLNLCAQQRLAFEPAEWDFGTIDEAAGPVTHVFRGTNVSDRPLVILNVVSSCGCTVPEFSRRPVLPGRSVEIRVTYDPMNRPGAFDKELTVFDEEKRPAARLGVRGQVTPRERSIEELYPVDAGAGVRLTQSFVNFSTVAHARTAAAAVGVANTSGRPLRFELVPQTVSGFVRTEYPRTLAPGVAGEIRIECRVPSESGRYGTLRDVLTLRIEGADSRVPLVTHAVATDNPHLSNEISAPKAVFDKYIIKFGSRKRSERNVESVFTVANEGDGELVIRSVEAPEGVDCTLRAEQRIAPGAVCAAAVTFDPSLPDYGPYAGQLLVVTNDAARPVRRIRVTAIVEE